MTRALAFSTAWIACGFGTAALLFWAFLNTPESTIWTLGLSLVLALVLYAVAGVTSSGALLGWSRGWSLRSLARARGGLAAFLPPLLLVTAAWWITGAALGWMDRHAGEISAWFMVRFGWADVRPLLTAITYAGNWVRAVLVPFAALVWLGCLLDHGWRPLVDRRCAARAFAPRTLILVTAIAWIAIDLPLTYGLYWMPRGLPATWIEPAFAALKLGAIGLLAAIGLSLIVRAAAHGRHAGPT